MRSCPATGALIRQVVTIFLILILAGCGTNSTPATAVMTDSLEPTASISPTPTPTPVTIPVQKVNASSMTHKLLMGYQGWFTCPGDGSQVNGYFHWFKGNIPLGADFKPDMWPDSSELTPAERCLTKMEYPDGKPASLYSAYNPKTVLRHFEWMNQYGIDGVFLQRFGSELSKPALFDERNVVTRNVRAGTEATGRVFALMYDVTGMEAATFVSTLETDWKYMVDVLNVTASPSYLHHNGKPVLGIWGLGFKGHPGTPQQALELVDFFENNPDLKYRVTLLGGVPTEWRTLQKDSLSDPGWAKYYCALNVISPWTVKRYKSDAQVDLYKSTMIADMAAAKRCEAEYMPVVFPGFSFHNSSGSVLNETPRRGGNLYWRQVYNAVSIGAPMIYNAMFDEVDEGTAMFKIAASAIDQPEVVNLVSLDADGYDLPSDWYLRLAGAATQMLRGETPLTEKIPIQTFAPTP